MDHVAGWISEAPPSPSLLPCHTSVIKSKKENTTTSEVTSSLGRAVQTPVPLDLKGLGHSPAAGFSWDNLTSPLVDRKKKKNPTLSQGEYTKEKKLEYCPSRLPQAVLDE